MPSGAKKRKAAKKKKEYQSNNHTNSSSAPTQPHGDGDVKHHGDRESDVGEVSSRASQDNQKLPAEGEEEEIGRESKLSNLPSVEGLGTDSGEKHVEVEGSAFLVEREFKIEDELVDRKHGSVEHDKAARKSHEGGSSESSSNRSCSDDESQDIKNRQADSGIASVDSVKVADSLSGKPVELRNSPVAEVGDSIMENIAAFDLEKITVLSKQVEVDVHSPADTSVAPCLVESAFKENGEKMLSSVEDKISASVALVGAALERKEEAIVQSDTNAASTLDPKECVAQENTLPYNAPRYSADNGAEHMKDSAATQPVLAPPIPVEKTSWKSCCGLFEVFSRAGA